MNAKEIVNTVENCARKIKAEHSSLEIQAYLDRISIPEFHCEEEIMFDSAGAILQDAICKNDYNIIKALTHFEEDLGIKPELTGEIVQTIMHIANNWERMVEHKISLEHI